MLKIRQQLTTLVTIVLMVTFPRNREKVWAGRTLIDAHGFMHSEDEQGTLQLLDILQNIKFQKVLEVGGNCGARLFLLARNQPQINVICTDINQSALQVGRDYARHNQIHNLHFDYLNVQSKKSLKLFFNNYSPDLILSWATLIYVHPIFIKSFFIELISAKTKTLILIEQDSKNLFWPFTYGKLIGRDKWIRNYESIVRRACMKHGVAINLQRVNCSVNMWNPRGGKASILIFKFGYHNSANARNY